MYGRFSVITASSLSGRNLFNPYSYSSKLSSKVSSKLLSSTPLSKVTSKVSSKRSSSSSSSSYSSSLISSIISSGSGSSGGSSSTTRTSYPSSLVTSKRGSSRRSYVSSPEYPIEEIITPPSIDINFNPFYEKKLKKLKSRKGRYMPSLIAVGQNIFGRKPKNYTGLTIRPISF